jgi:phosphoribosylanthranilate isomerase
MNDAIVKICGATTPGDVGMVASSGADLVGLWYGIAGGPSDLSIREVSALAAATRITNRLQPVIVTFLNDPDVLLHVAARAGVQWVQLHGYQPPAMVRALKSAEPVPLIVVKVLHVQGDECVELPLLKSYERAGTDFFLLDTTTQSGRIGSTGQTLQSSVVLDIADRMSLPFLLAGGINAHNRLDFEPVVEHPRFFGIDVDSAARDPNGKFRMEQIAAIRANWQTERDERATA